MVVVACGSKAPVAHPPAEARSARPVTLAAEEPSADGREAAGGATQAAAVQFGRVNAVFHRALPDAGELSEGFAKPQAYEGWRQQRSIWVGKGYLSLAGFLADERLAFTFSDDDGKIRLYELPAWSAVSSVELEGHKQFARAELAEWPAAESLAARLILADESGLFTVDPRTGQRLERLASRPAWQLKWSDDRRLLVAHLPDLDTQTSVLELYDASQGQLELAASLAFAERVDGWDLDRANRRLAVVYYPSDEIEVLSLADRRLLWKAATVEFAGSVDFSPDGSKVAVGGSEVVLFGVEDPSQSARYTRFDNNVHEVRFSPSGDALAVSAYDGRVRILSIDLDSPTLRLRKELRHSGSANVYALAFRQDGSALLSSSGDQTLRLWGP